MITKPLLASPADMNKIEYPLLGSPKLDGIRAIVVGGRLLSRSFKPIPNIHINKELLKHVKDGFDGEIMLRDPKATFQDITSAVMSIEGNPDFVYCVFDYVYDSLFTPYYLRVKKLCEVAEGNKYIRVIKPRLIKDRESLDAYETACLEEGYEGIMVRSPSSMYKCGRSTVKESILLKIKRFEDSEAVILSVFEKMKNNNEQEKDELGHSKRSTKKEGMTPTGTLGGFIVKDIKTGVTFSIGSGLNDETRSKIWKSKDDYTGKIVKYKYQPYGVKDETGVPRFPVYVGFRSEIDM